MEKRRRVKKAIGMTVTQHLKVVVLCNTFNIFLDLISCYFMKDFCIFKGVVLVYSFHLLYFLCWASLVTQTVKNLHAVQETQV